MPETSGDLKLLLDNGATKGQVLKHPKCISGIVEHMISRGCIFDTLELMKSRRFFINFEKDIEIPMNFHQNHGEKRRI